MAALAETGPVPVEYAPVDCRARPVPVEAVIPETRLEVPFENRPVEEIEAPLGLTEIDTLVDAAFEIEMELVWVD